MRLIIRDLIKFFSFFLVWGMFVYDFTKENSSIFNFLVSYFSFNENLKDSFTQVVLSLPGWLVIYSAYKAGISICYNILFIDDCEKEYDELVQEIKQEGESLKNRIEGSK